VSIWREASGDFAHGVSLGLVPGWEAFRKFGANPSVGTGGAEEIWPPGTVRTLPTAAGVASVSSDATADDGDPQGTGAGKILISGLDANWLEISETVTLNGTTPVNTVNSFLRIHRMYCTTVGIGGINAGNITATIGGNAQSYVRAGEGQTAVIGYTVPANKYFLLNYYSVGVGRMAGSSDANVDGQIRLYNGTGWDSWRSISNIYLFNGQEHTNAVSVTLLPPKTDLRGLVTSSVATQSHAIFGGYLVRTDHIGKI
jgi:hypothetical protein